MTPRGKTGSVNLEKTKYFDSLSSKWDTLQDFKQLNEKIEDGLSRINILENEHILDIGCGTGNLTKALLSHLSTSGRVSAVDISPTMITLARRKIAGKRVAWRIAYVNSLPFENESFDRAICYSVWPHVGNKLSAIAELRRVLRKGGKLHIWHTLSRNAVNAIHQKSGGPLKNDHLAPASETAALLESHKFVVTEKRDTSEYYLVTAIKSSNYQEEKGE
jgi:ubiquinone/menaquinone biosynthesis C-methylase UbiE